MSIRFKIGVIFLLIQCVSVLMAGKFPEKFFCWAPYDEHTLLTTAVVIDNTNLSAKEIEERYRYRMNGWEPRSVHNAFNIVEQYENSYGAKDSAIVRITYSINGHPSQQWLYPKSIP